MAKCDAKTCISSGLLKSFAHLEWLPEYETSFKVDTPFFCTARVIYNLFLIIFSVFTSYPSRIHSISTSGYCALILRLPFHFLSHTRRDRAVVPPPWPVACVSCSGSSLFASTAAWQLSAKGFHRLRVWVRKRGSSLLTQS